MQWSSELNHETSRCFLARKEPTKSENGPRRLPTHKYRVYAAWSQTG